MTRHTKLFGSTSYRTLNCPAHYQRSAAMPERPTNAAAEEGTMLHGFVQEVLEVPQSSPEDYDWWTTLDADQRRIVTTHVDFVRQLAVGGTLMVEHRSSSPHLHPEWFGTADAVILKPPLLTIADLKCGRVAVEVEDDAGDINAQLASYAISVLANLPAAVIAKIKRVELVIVQPRSGGVKRRIVTIPELMAMRDRLLEAARLADSADPPAAAGKWCKFCPAAPTCPTLRAHVQETAKLDFALDNAEPADLSIRELNETLHAVAIAEDWIASVKQYAEQILSAGGDIEGEWELTPKRAVRKWKDERVAKQRLLSEGIDPIEERVISPAKAEELAKRKHIDLDLSDLTKAESSGMKLTQRNKEEEDFDGGW